LSPWITAALMRGPAPMRLIAVMSILSRGLGHENRAFEREPTAAVTPP
jgi:hypothetical protein